MIFYVLFFFSGIGIMGSVLQAKASPSSYLVPLNPPTDTPTPTPTNTPTPTPTDTPTPPTPTPIPPTPPPAPTTPARPTVPGVGPMPTSSAVTTPTATITATATSTVTGILPTSIYNSSIKTTKHTPPLNPDSGGNTGNSGVLGLSLGIGTSGIFLLGGGLFWFYLRRKQQGLATLQKGKMNTTGLAFSANRDMITGANMFQQPISPVPQGQAGPVYTPGALLPMTSALPKQIPNQQVPSLTPYASASEMNPLSFEAFDIPQGITTPTPLGQRISQPLPAITPANHPSFNAFGLPQEFTTSTPLEQRISQPLPAIPPTNLPPMGDLNLPSFDAFDSSANFTPFTPLEQRISQPIPAIPPANLPPVGEISSSTVTPPPNVPLLATAERLPVQPPDVAEDHILMEVMRQAQSGLFVLSD